MTKIKFALHLIAIAIFSCNISANQKINIKIILGSTRAGRVSEKLGAVLKSMADTNENVSAEVIDLRDYNLPFLNDEVPPIMREKINDPVIQRWSDKISEADAYVLVVPEYNYGYSGVLKNAMDLLYKEWNDKPVGLIGYSGGESGAKNAVSQLRQVLSAFKMIPVDIEINIGSSWKAFDTKGNLVQNIEGDFDSMITKIVEAVSKK